MPATTQGARSGVCERCQSKYTLAFTVEQVGDGYVSNLAPFTCPKCGHGGTIASPPGQRIISVAAKPYVDPLGR